jgi:transposase
VETIGKIRRRGLRDDESISSLARSLQLSRNTVRKYLKDGVEPVYKRKPQAGPQLGPWCGRLDEWLRGDGLLPKTRRQTALRLFECLQAEGYAGAYDSVQRHVRQWKIEAGRATSTKAFVPLLFASGDVAQFDWSYEHVVLGGTTTTIKLAHFRLAYSRQMFVVAYPREAQEMVLDAHNRAFAFFGGVPRKVIYDNLKTVVDAVFADKERQFNRRFLALASHYLFEPVVDEVDKAGTIHSAAGRPSSLTTSLLPLLEPGSSRRFECPYHRLSCDLSRVIWIMTSNNADLIPAPLRDRARVFHLAGLTPDEAVTVFERMTRCSDDRSKQPDCRAFIRRMATPPEGISLRQIRQLADAVTAPPRPLTH